MFSELSHKNRLKLLLGKFEIKKRFHVPLATPRGQ